MADESLAVTTSGALTPADLRPATPADLLRHALDSGVDIERLSQLMELQIRWQREQAANAYTASMARFKADCPPVIDQDAKVAVKSRKTGQTHGYTHASLGGITGAITPHLSAHGLSVTYQLGQEKGVVTVTCRVTHVDGHREEVALTAAHDGSGSKNAIQALGSSVTYLKRYTLLAALGLATADEDDDGRSSGPPTDEPVREAVRASSKPAEFAPCKKAVDLAEQSRLTDSIDEINRLELRDGSDLSKQNAVWLRTQLGRRRLAILRGRAEAAVEVEVLAAVEEIATKHQDRGLISEKGLTWLLDEVIAPHRAKLMQPAPELE